MAKKTVINDFSALKGKVYFSEQPVADNKKSVVGDPAVTIVTIR